MKTIEGYNIKIFTDNIEQQALDQLGDLLHVPAFSDKMIRIMPDCHAGAGCVIGFTADLGDKVVPNLIGVDIGCGMLVYNLGKVEIDLKKFDKTIYSEIPSGLDIRDTRDNAYKEVRIDELYCKKSIGDLDYYYKSIGTLGGGNHFIELDKDDSGNIYLVIHTGSRNLGLKVCKYYQDLAIKTCQDNKKELKEKTKALVKEYQKTNRTSEIQDAIAKLKANYPKRDIPDSLCYLEGENRDNYLHDMKICQEYARVNRMTILKNILIGYFGTYNPKDIKKESFETVHNYISSDNYIRKGAVSAEEGETLIIPMNMKDGSLICTGKGNPDWNYSAPHGAGRIMSRAEASRTLSLDDYQEDMSGIYTTSVCEETKDESPRAYKPMQEIVDNIQDTVTIDRIIKPIYNFKAAEVKAPWKK